MAMVSGIFMPPSISKTGTRMLGISEKNEVRIKTKNEKSQIFYSFFIIVFFVISGYFKNLKHVLAYWTNLFWLFKERKIK